MSLTSRLERPPERSPSRFRAADSWQSLLVGADRERAVAVVGEIADGLRDAAPSKQTGADHASLCDGDAGLAVFHAYVGRSGFCRDENAVTGHLDAAAKAAADVPMTAGLYEGITGIAWAVEHLQGGGDEDLNEAIDEALLDHLNRSPWPGEYDLIGGLVGVGVYASERLHRPSGSACLERVIDRLDELAWFADSGITWFTPPEFLSAWQRNLCPNGYFNLGLAHGVPGVIALLGGAIQAGGAGHLAGQSIAKARRLLTGAVSWLLSERLPEGGGSSFSSWTGPGVERVPGRLAWCYGDLGVASALFWAARAIGLVEWEEEAVALARNAARRPDESSGVEDAGLCHGAAGIGHIFNRLFQASNEPELERAARCWLLRAIDMRRPGVGIAGYQVWEPLSDGTFGWSPNHGILTGAAGIGLALLAATTPIEPAWDRMLMVSSLDAAWNMPLASNP